MPKKWYNGRVDSSKLGVVDCISVGFSAVYRKPAILIVPILVDLLLCFTPRISPQPLIENLTDAGTLQEAHIESAGFGVAIPASPEESLTVENFEALGDLNLSGILGTQVQSYLAFPSSGRSGQAVIEVETWQGLMLSLVVFIFGSIVIGTIYLEMLAQYIKVGSPWPIREGHLPSLAVNLLGYIALVTGIYGAIAISCLFLITLAPALLPIIALLGITAAFLALIYLLVGETVLFIEGLTPIQALKRSMVFAHSHLVQLASLIILSAVLGFAMQILLGNLATYSLGLPPAIFLNALVMTSLTIAVMSYYWNHTEHWGIQL